jgi:tetratricopeptide (TPR) repeat protein
MFPDQQNTYPGRKFIQALQVGLVIAIGAFSFMALTRPHEPEPDFTPMPTVAQVISTSVPDYTAAPVSTAYDLYEKGRAQDDMGNFDQAIDLYTQALELDSTMADAWLSRAVAYAESGTNARLSNSDFWHYVQNTETERLERDITLDQSLKLEMTQGRVYKLSVEVKSGDVLTISAKSVQNGEPGDTNVVDPLVLLFNPEDVLAQADDDTLRRDGSLINMNSRIEDYEVTEDGTYTILITHAGGGSVGTIDVKVSVR